MAIHHLKNIQQVREAVWSLKANKWKGDIQIRKLKHGYSFKMKKLR